MRNPFKRQHKGKEFLDNEEEDEDDDEEDELFEHKPNERKFPFQRKSKDEDFLTHIEAQMTRECFRRELRRARKRSQEYVS
jgi:hypothetical protein